VKWMAVALAVLLPLAACKSGDTSSAPKPAAAKLAPNDQVLATIGTDRITQSEIQPVLMEAYGLPVLLKFVELHLVRERAAAEHIVITQADIDAERVLTMQMLKKAAQEQTAAVGGTAASQPDEVVLSPAEMDQLLDRMLTMQQISRAEFNHCLLEVNATLRKLAEPTIQPLITEDAVHAQFNQTYGEKALVHYILVQNMVDAQSVEQDLAGGKTFEEAAQAKGQEVKEFQPFSRVTAEIPEVIRQVVFSLKPGQVSDPVQINQFILVMKLMDLIAPQHAKYEDYKDAVRQTLHDAKLKEAMNKLNVQLARSALDIMQINDPMLKKQWEQRREASNVQAKSAADIRKQLDQTHADQAAAATIPSIPNPFGPAATMSSPAQAPSTAPAQ